MERSLTPKKGRSLSASQYDLEEDDATVIVYNDATLEESWDFSQFSASQSQNPTMRKVEQNANEPHRHNQPKQEAPSSIPRKRRQRGFARGGRNLRLNNDIPNKNDSHDYVDDFASLRSTIDRLSPRKQESRSDQQQCDSDGETSTKDEGDEDGGSTSHSQISTSVDPINQKQLSVNLLAENKDDDNESSAPERNELKKDKRLCSPPDFDFCNFDSDDDEMENEKEKKQETSNRRSIPPPRLRVRDHNAGIGGGEKRKHSSSEREESTKKQSKRRSSNVSHLPTQISVPSSLSTARNHKRKRPETIGRRAFASSQQPALSQPTKSSTTCDNVKSIVGLRPTHWRRGTNKVQKRNSEATERKPLRQLAKSSALMAATRFSFHKTSQQTRGDTIRRVEKHSFHFGQRTKNSDRSPIERNDEDDISPEREKPSNDPAKSSFSFAPSFVQTKSSALSQDSIGDDSGDDSRVVTTQVNHFALTPPLQRRRRSKAANGEWVRRLIALQNTQSNDLVRLQNKAFSRHRILLDASDPRKRAKTFTDVTILGQYVGPWINVPEDMKIMVLGFVHSHSQRAQATTSNIRTMAPQQPTQNQRDTTAESKDFFAWFTFTLATARRIELQKGCKLRIYNAIILPCRSPVQLDAPPTSLLCLENGNGFTGTVCCEKTVICTNLCERIDSLN